MGTATPERIETPISLDTLGQLEDIVSNPFDSYPPSPALSVHEVEVKPLPPVDTGIEAWKFIFAATLYVWRGRKGLQPELVTETFFAGHCRLETLIWGYAFSYGVLQVHLSTNPPFNTSSSTSIAAVGTVSLALQYMAPAFLLTVFRRYAEKAKLVLWIAMGVNVGSMLLSSFATAVRCSLQFSVCINWPG